MGVFALNERFSGVGVSRIFLAVSIRVVHRAEDVGLASLVSLFVLYGA